ncbi:MAG: glucose-6-phosphate isomerase [Pseudomonadota bacterium]|nr:glucose-6-phosphate isomerase [Pseudomonadota bacterium]
MSSSINKKTIEKKLKEHYEKLSKSHLSDFFNDDKNRGKGFSVELSNLFIDFSKNHITKETLTLLSEYAETLDIKSSIDAMFSGKKINTTEERAALHPALRSKSEKIKGAEDGKIREKIENELQKIKNFTSLVHDKKTTGWTNKPIDTFVNIGIGGSDLGPKMVVNALNQYRKNKTHSFFISNIDFEQIELLKRKINPETTLFIISSKSFTTIETITNANTIKSWLIKSGCDDADRHFAIVTANREAAKEFGVKNENIFQIWDWVGGRFSLWSAVGLSISLAIGFDNFEKMLSGAYEMDEHFLKQPLEKNIPITLALIDFWYICFHNRKTHAIIPYDESLRYLPSYLSQLFMESNGKSTDLCGEKINYDTGAIIWGEVGTNSQHSIGQLLHQGKHVVPIDFLAPLSKKGNQKHHELLLANCFAQSRTLMLGDNNENSHLQFDGNKPSTTILYNELNPKTLGSLLAMYEHRVFAQGLLLEINSFDQYGIELGKKMALEISENLQQKEININIDSSTKNLMAIYKESKKNSKN